jgi:HK97 family phage portal protein
MGRVKQFLGRLWSGRSNVPAKVEMATSEDLASLFALLKQYRPQDLMASFLAERPILPDWSTQQAIEEGYKQSSWVYTCIYKTALTLSSVPWVVHRLTDDGELEPAPESGLATLLRKPNPWFSWQSMVFIQTQYLLLGGNSIVTKVKVDGVTGELWPFSPARVRPVPSKTEFIGHYEFRDEAGSIKDVPADTVVHLMLPDPDELHWGMSPLKAAAKAVDADREAGEWQINSLSNMMFPPGAFIYPGNVTKAQVTRAKEVIADQFAGADNARVPLMVGLGPKYEPMAMTPAELDFVSSREMNAEEICAVFQIPPPVVGLLRKATYSNIETANRMWWEQTLVPSAMAMVAAYNLQLTPEFGEDLIIMPETSNLPALLSRFAEKVSTAKDLFSMGVPFNTINQRMKLGFPSIQGGDVGYLPANLFPVGTSVSEDE